MLVPVDLPISGDPRRREQSLPDQLDHYLPVLLGQLHFRASVQGQIGPDRNGHLMSPPRLAAQLMDGRVWHLPAGANNDAVLGGLAVDRPFQIPMLPEDPLAAQVAFAPGREFAALLQLFFSGQTHHQDDRGVRLPGGAVRSALGLEVLQYRSLKEGADRLHGWGQIQGASPQSVQQTLDFAIIDF